MEKYSSQTHKKTCKQPLRNKRKEPISKLRYLFKHKQEMTNEKYMSNLSRSEASTIFKLWTRIINLKNDFRNIYKHDILCPRHKK